MTPSLTPDQQAAANAFMLFMTDPQQTMMVISGPAGSGKSTLTRHLVDLVKQQMKAINLLLRGDTNTDINLLATAPTNKAARVIADVMGNNTQPLTVYSLFGLRPVPNFRTGEMRLQKTTNFQLCENSLLIIDEASFVGHTLLQGIFDSTKNCKVLFIGDAHQLTDPKDKVKELSQSTLKDSGGMAPVFELDIPQAYLTSIVRQDNKTGKLHPITALAEAYRQVLVQADAIRLQLRQGRITKTDYAYQVSQIPLPTIQADNKFLYHVDGPTFKKTIEWQFSQTDMPEDDGRILAWTNERVHEYNNHIRQFKGLPPILSIGERVVTNKPILTTNNPISTDTTCTVTYVGDELSILDIPGNMIGLDNERPVFLPHSQKAVNVLLKALAQEAKKKGDWTNYYDIKERWADLRPLSACTVHKSQGSTYHTAYIDLDDIGSCYDRLEFARMMYVAISRASHRVVFYGQLPYRFRGVA